MTMFKGVHHIGIGVSDMEQSMKFYSDCIGFNEVVFDYSGPLPGIQWIAGKPKKARVVMLKSEFPSPLGLGMIKLVQLLPPDKPTPIPEGTCWGEIGIAETCISVQGNEEIYRQLVKEKGCECILPLEWSPLPPHDVNTGLWYTTDPDGGKVELIEWRGAYSGFEKKARINGVNHVAFGVSDMGKSIEFYQKLGFKDLLFDFSGVFESMNHWFPKPTHQHIVLLANHYGAGVELVEHTPRSKDLRGDWGHLGPMEFAIEVSNLEEACEEIQKVGIDLLGTPQTLDVPSGQWKYAFIADPDGLYVSLIEPRF